MPCQIHHAALSTSDQPGAGKQVEALCGFTASVGLNQKQGGSSDKSQEKSKESYKETEKTKHHKIGVPYCPFKVHNPK